MKFEQILAELAGKPMQIEFCLLEEKGPENEQAPPLLRPTSPHQRLAQVASHPMLSRAAELLGAIRFGWTNPRSKEESRTHTQR